MKKTLAILLSVMLLVSASVGCGNENRNYAYKKVTKKIYFKELIKCGFYLGKNTLYLNLLLL